VVYSYACAGGCGLRRNACCCHAIHEGVIRVYWRRRFCSISGFFLLHAVGAGFAGRYRARFESCLRAHYGCRWRRHVLMYRQWCCLLLGRYALLRVCRAWRHGGATLLPLHRLPCTALSTCALHLPALPAPAAYLRHRLHLCHLPACVNLNLSCVPQPSVCAFSAEPGAVARDKSPWTTLS